MRSRDACLREAGGLPGAAQPPTTAAEIVKAARCASLATATRWTAGKGHTCPHHAGSISLSACTLVGTCVLQGLPAGAYAASDTSRAWPAPAAIQLQLQQQATDIVKRCWQVNLSGSSSLEAACHCHGATRVGTRCHHPQPSAMPPLVAAAACSHDFLSAASSDGVTSWGSHISVAGHAGESLELVAQHTPSSIACNDCRTAAPCSSWEDHPLAALSRALLLAYALLQTSGPLKMGRLQDSMPAHGTAQGRSCLASVGAPRPCQHPCCSPCLASAEQAPPAVALAALAGARVQPVLAAPRRVAVACLSWVP